MLETLKRDIWTAASQPTNRIAMQMPRALIVSGIAAGVDCGLLAFFVGYLHWHGLLAAIISYLLGGVIQYWLCLRWVFPYTPLRAVVGFTAFTLLSLVGLLITVLAIWAVHEQAHFPIAIAKGFSLLLAFGWNFFSRRYFIFGEHARRTNNLGRQQQRYVADRAIVDSTKCKSEAS